MRRALAQHPLAVILIVALLLRLVVAVGVQMHLDRAGREFLIPGDAEGYRLLAATIVAGDEYAVYEPPRRVMRMPGFPLFLAAVHLLWGPALLPARLTLALVSTAGVGGVFLLGRALVDARTGCVAAGICAIWPVLVGFSVLILSETLFAVLLTFSLWAMARLVAAGNGSALSSAAVVGLLIGGATYIRPTWLPVAVVFPFGYWFWAGRTRAAAANAAVVVVAAGLLLVPWTLRNWQVTRHAVVTTLWVGPSLYDGLGPQATGESDMQFFEQDRLLDRMSEYEMDREYRRRAWRFAAEHPGRAVWLSMVKLWRYVQPWPSAAQFGSWPARVVIAGFYLPALAFAAVGAWVRRRNVWLLVLSGGPLLLFAAVHSLFVGSLRYRLPAEYPLCVLAAVGLQVSLRWRSSAMSRDDPQDRDGHSPA